MYVTHAPWLWLARRSEGAEPCGMVRTSPLLAVVVCLAACAPGPEPLSTVAQTLGPPCFDASLSAARSYSPAKNFPAEREFGRSIVFAVPPSLEVTTGNAGNGTAVLIATLEGQEIARCRYKGGASVQAPQDADDILRGQRYLFQRCDTQQQAGSFLIADALKLTIHDGSAAFGPTTARVHLDEVGGNCAPIGFLQAPPLDRTVPNSFHTIVSFLYQPTETTSPVQLESDKAQSTHRGPRPCGGVFLGCLEGRCLRWP